MSKFWKDIAPNEWKLYGQIKRRRKNCLIQMNVLIHFTFSKNIVIYLE